jgi:hypothetical protein
MASPFNYEEWLKVAQPPVAQPPAQAPQQPPGPIVPPVAMPYYSLKGLVLKPGDPIAAMSQNELSSLNADSGLEFYQSEGGGHTVLDPNTGYYDTFDANEAANRLVKTRQAVTGGTQKMVLPVGTVQRKVTKEQYKTGTKPSSAQEFFLVPQGTVPQNYFKYNPDFLKEIENDPIVVSNARALHKFENDGSDFEQNRDYYIKKAVSGMRRQILEAHYGKGNIASAFLENEQEKAAPKVLPNALPVGIQGTRFQFNMPFLPTLYGAVNAAQGSALDAAAGDRMWGGGQALLDLTDVEKRTSLAEASQRVTPGQIIPKDTPLRITQKRVQPPIIGDGSEVSNFVNNLITSRYSADQLAGMTHEEKKKIAFEATGEFFQNKAKESLAQAFAITKEKREGSSEFQTEEAYSPDFSISKLTQQAASSAVPTAAPMLASMLGSLATGGPWGGKAASAAVTYKLSADSEFMGKLFEWAANNGIDVNNDPEVVMQQLVDMAAKDPRGFSGKLREMVHSARVAGGLEAGVAFTLNEGLEKINIPWAKEGSVWEAMRKLGNKDISQVLAPRVANMLQETGKEALEEYLTEVFVGLGKGIDQQVQKGDEYWEATKKQVRELIESYKGDEPNADSEQRNTAAQIGAYMSLLMKTFTGKGNPDTALIRQARTKAAKALAEKYRGQPMGTAEKIELALANMENAAASARLEKANEIMILEGHGSMWRTNYPLDQSYQEFLPPAPELPDNVQPPPAARSPEDEEANAIREQYYKEQAARDAARDAAEQARRDRLNEETAAYQRARDLESEIYAANEKVNEARKNYHYLLDEYQNNMDHPEVRAALDALNEAQAEYDKAESRRGK